MANKPKWEYNRAPVFTGENYGYWKTCMRIHINSYNKGVWDVIINGPSEIIMDVDGFTVPKPEAQQSKDDKETWSYDWKA